MSRGRKILEMLEQPSGDSHESKEVFDNSEFLQNFGPGDIIFSNNDDIISDPSCDENDNIVILQNVRINPEPIIQEAVAVTTATDALVVPYQGNGLASTYVGCWNQEEDLEELVENVEATAKTADIETEAHSLENAPDTLQNSKKVENNQLLKNSDRMLVSQEKGLEDAGKQKESNKENLSNNIETNVETQEEDRSLLYTKKGEKRRRQKKGGESKTVKKQKILRNIIQNHQVLTPCSSACKKKCNTKIDPTMRQQLNEQYWKLNWSERHLYIENSIEQTSVKRRTTQISSNQAKHRRESTLKFLLRDQNGSLISVCRTFLLTTLGYAKTNNTIIKTSLSSKSLVADNRGKHLVDRRTVDRTILERHILSFQPCVSHYRRQHAPNRRYLPSDVNIVTMYSDFKEKHPLIAFSYHTYRAFLKKDMNISFAKLGHEECETCEVFKQHNNAHSEDNLDLDSCDYCKKWHLHITKARESRKLYREDADCTKRSETNICVSADLQKVIMLPRMDTFKQVLFTPRIIVFNESFVPVGKNQKFSGPVAVSWHEAIAGRKKEAICSTFHKYILQNRDVLHIKFWLDNCAGQNKNWTLFSVLASLINSTQIVANIIEIYYFEPGHSFMSADSFHHQVEQSMNSYEGDKICDFDDFRCAVEKVKMKNVKASVMDISDFTDWKDNSSVTKIKKHSPRPYLNNIVKIQFKRGSFCLGYSCEYNSPYKDLDFLTQTSIKRQIIPVSRVQCRGFKREGKAAIIKRLCPLMPENRRTFWKDLPTSDTDVDLHENTDDDD